MNGLNGVNPSNHHPARIAKADKDFAKTLEFKEFHRHYRFSL